jgi:hypothetical protein
MSTNGYLTGTSAIINVWNPAGFQKLIPDYGNDHVGSINDALHEGSNDIDPLPAAIYRGGLWTSGDNAGVFMLDASRAPASLNNALGFRCAK